jgi:hypothetical protein
MNSNNDDREPFNVEALSTVYTEYWYYMEGNDQLLRRSLQQSPMCWKDKEINSSLRPALRMVCRQNHDGKQQRYRTVRVTVQMIPGGTEWS